MITDGCRGAVKTIAKHTITDHVLGSLPYRLTGVLTLYCLKVDSNLLMKRKFRCQT